MFDAIEDQQHIYTCIYKAVDKWVLGGVEAPPNFWHLYIAHSHSTQLLMMCSES